MGSSPHCDGSDVFHGTHLTDDDQQKTAHIHNASPSPASETSAPSVLSATFPADSPAYNQQENTLEGAASTIEESSKSQPWYWFSTIDGVEQVEDYRPGGLLPISLGDKLLGGRYVILQKLGHGGSSTIWLARDQNKELVSLKAMYANMSHLDPSHIPDLAIPQRLKCLYPRTDYFRTSSHYFYEPSPNGKHLVVVYPLAGPNVASLYALPTIHYWEPPKAIGSRRFRADFAKKVAKDTAMGLYQMHSAGIIHGGELLSTSRSCLY